MRIAIVCTYYPFPPSVGGVETIVRNVAVELARRGHEVHIISSNLDVTTQKPATELGTEERGGIIAHKLKPSSFRIGYARILKGLKEIIAKIKPDIVHEHNLHPHLFQLAKWKEGIGYKLAAELHYPAIELDYLIQKMLLPFTITVLRYGSKEVDIFIAHTKMEKEWLVNSGIEIEKIHVIRLPGISSELLNVDLPNSPPYDIIYVGRIVPRKGLHILLESLYKVRKNVQNIKTTIVGPADRVYLEYLMKLASQFGLEQVVEFKGVIDEMRKHELITQHKILVAPSIKDYTPNVIMEAQALGVPVISTRVGAIPEMVIDGETGFLVEPGNVDQLTDAILKLLRDEDLRRRMSVSAREWAKNFTLDKAVDRLESIYRELVEK